MARKMIHNPVLPGFHPDPSILQVDGTYYLATSTFHWFPGMRLHRSYDLANWELIGHALTRPSQLDMLGVPDHGGVWAPCLSYDAEERKFYLLYTVVLSRPTYLSDAPNFLVTADDPAGPWSEPVYLNGRGFDPSLFHDDDGRKWLVQMQWDHRPGNNPFAGITLQEYSPDEGRLVGESKVIFTGTHHGRTEGPHLYKRGGWHYLLTAEGGTSWDHGETVARSRKIEGPYELAPGSDLVTSRDNPEARLQKAGHGSLVETPNGEWYFAHLCSREVGSTKRCVLGRETALQRVYWDEDGWPRLADGGVVPQDQVPAPALTPHPITSRPANITFDRETLDPRLCTLREPASDEWIGAKQRPGWLRMKGRWSLHASRNQSFVGRRVLHHRCTAETHVEFSPTHFQHMAGLVAYYDMKSHYYFHLTHDENVGPCLSLLECNRGALVQHLAEPLPIEPGTPCHLRARLDGEKLRFAYRQAERDWRPAGPTLDSTILSDDYAELEGFTGMFFGLCVQDLTGGGKAADFEYLNYHADSPATVPSLRPVVSIPRQGRILRRPSDRLVK